MNTGAPERVDLPVSGMTCAACARSIEMTLAGTPGVARAQVNLATSTATVEYDPASVQVADFVGSFPISSLLLIALLFGSFSQFGEFAQMTKASKILTIVLTVCVGRLRCAWRNVGYRSCVP